MTDADRERLIARITSGKTLLRVRRKTYLLARPSPLQIYHAQELYHRALKKAVPHSFDENSLLDLLVENGLWSEEQEKLLASLPKEIEDFKVALYQSAFKSNELKTIRLALNKAKSTLLETFAARHRFDHLTAHGVASMVRSRYLMRISLLDTSGQPIRGSKKDTPDFVDKAIEELGRKFIGEGEIRELARTNPWQSLWCARRASPSIFGGSVQELTDEQQQLIQWSVRYDSIHEHPERPAKEVIEDDDRLDGWMILQARQAGLAQNSKDADNMIGNEKIRNSQEVYLLADTTQDAQQINELNTPAARRRKQRREKMIREKGTVNEMEFPDVKKRLQMELNQKRRNG